MQFLVNLHPVYNILLVITKWNRKVILDITDAICGTFFVLSNINLYLVRMKNQKMFKNKLKKMQIINIVLENTQTKTLICYLSISEIDMVHQTNTSIDRGSL